MFTRPFTSLAMAGDALEPGDSEYRIGRLSCVKTCMIFSEDSELASNSLIKNVYALNLLYISSRVFSEEKKRENKCMQHIYIPQKHNLSQLDLNHHQIHSHFSLLRSRSTSEISNSQKKNI